MIRRLYRFATGILTIRVTGRGVTRFMNLCIKTGIHLWKVECADNAQFTFCMYLRDLYALKPFLRKTHVKLRIQKRTGIPFLLDRYRARKVFALVILLVIGAVLWLSTRIWRIEVVGNSFIGEDVVLKYLKEQNITYGSAEDCIDNDELELSLRQDFDEIIWASVYTEGTKLVVHIQEKIASDRPQETGDVCMDLVASRDAQIVSIITRHGAAQVVSGDEVHAGDILVSGRQEILDDNGEVKEYYYQSADADVMGHVVYDYEDWIPEKLSLEQKTGQVQNQYYMIFGNYQWMLPKLYADYDQYETLDSKKQLCLMQSFYLPVFYGHITYMEQKTVEVTLTKDEVKALALEHLEQYLEDLEENGVSILDKNVMIEKVGANYHIYGEISASESIAKPALTEILPQPSAAQEEESDESE